MKTYDPDKPLIYTHIPKCAGTSFVQLLREWFGPRYHKLNQDETQDIVLPHVPIRGEHGRRLPDVGCIHGHFNHGRGYGLPYFYPDVDQYLRCCETRDLMLVKFDIVCSMYFFAKAQVSCSPPPLVFHDCETLDIVSYFFAKARSAAGQFWFRGQPVDIRQQHPNLESYVRDYPYWLFDHLPQDLTLANYEELLPERFVYIGILEDMPTSIKNLATVLDQPQSTLPRANVSTYDEAIPEHLRPAFYQQYPLLEKIYQFAVENYQNV